MMVPLALLLLAALVAALAPRVLTRADWPAREPVLALWVWQCAVAAVLLCCALAMSLSAAAAWEAVRGHVFAPAPHGVMEAYALGVYGSWAAPLAISLAAGALWTAAMLTREVRRARRRRRHAALRVRSPRLPGEPRGGERLVVLESDRPDAWLLRGGAAPRLVITTAALRRLDGSQLDAVLAHEQGHARARHDWLLHCSAALADGFPQVPVFAAFRDQVHHLVELAADDCASRRTGRLATALALVELNEDRGVFGPGASGLSRLPDRVDRLLAPAPRLTVPQRLRLTAVASLVPFVPVLVTFVPGLSALRG
ncbi:M56 family metallopeptidase [Streptomyces sp. NPDC049585]|uniref:M56 family metallopeptidase n=1 Tax=Streptomyces sp. NPDC049585 TaxID=3155154 RepID=UPI00343C2294